MISSPRQLNESISQESLHAVGFVKLKHNSCSVEHLSLFLIFKSYPLEKLSHGIKLMQQFPITFISAQKERSHFIFVAIYHILLKKLFSLACTGYAWAT